LVQRQSLFFPLIFFHFFQLNINLHHRAFFPTLAGMGAVAIVDLHGAFAFSFNYIPCLFHFLCSYKPSKLLLHLLLFTWCYYGFKKKESKMLPTRRGGKGVLDLLAHSPGMQRA